MFIFLYLFAIIYPRLVIMGLLLGKAVGLDNLAFL